MSDLYDAGNSKVSNELPRDGIFAMGRPIYHHVYIRGEMYEIIRNQRASCGCTKRHYLMWKPFSIARRRSGVRSHNAQAKQVPDDEKTSTMEFSMPMCSQ